MIDGVAPSGVSPGGRPHIRVARPADVDRLAAVEDEAFGADAYDEGDLSRLLSRTGCLVHLAERDGEVWGFAVTEILPLPELAARYGLPVDRLPRGPAPPDGPVGYFKSIAVRAARRRRGTGGALYEARLAMLAEMAVGDAFLLQMPRPGLAAFHRRMGFAPTGMMSSRSYADGARGGVWHRAVPS